MKKSETEEKRKKRSVGFYFLMGGVFILLDMLISFISAVAIHGGSCQPACHKKFRYDRVNPIGGKNNE